MIDIRLYPKLYEMLSAPTIENLDCGTKCAEWNDGKPVCCDLEGIHGAVPSVYKSEYEYLKGLKDNKGNKKWSKYRVQLPRDKDLLPIIDGDVYVKCTGFRNCKRENRSIVCRTFPFFPFFDERKAFVGMTVYMEYEKDCWVIQNQNRVNSAYVQEFQDFYLTLFALEPDEMNIYLHTSNLQWRIHKQRAHSVPVILFEDADLSPSAAKRQGIRVIRLCDRKEAKGDRAHGRQLAKGA